MSKSAPPAPPVKRSWLWLQGAAAGGIAVAMPGTALLLATLFAPGLTFFVMETTPDRPVSRIMLMTGSAGVVLPLRTLWEHGGSLPAGMDLLADPACALFAWLACGAGWMLCEVVELIAKLALGAKSRSRIASLEAEQAELVEEWTFPTHLD